MKKMLVLILFVMQGYCLAMDLVDSEGKRYRLTSDQFAYFCATDLGKQLKDDINQGNEVDLSGSNHVVLKGKNILSVLSHASNPSQLTLTTEVVPEEIQLLETANILGLPTPTCARHLAKRLWPVIQKNGPNPLKLSDWQKAAARAVARNYVPCPAIMLEYLEENKNSEKVRYIYNLVDWNSGIFNLSTTLCYSVGYADKFGTLNGLGNLVQYLGKNAPRTTKFNELILDGHMLDTFSLKDIQSIELKNDLDPLHYGLSRLSLRRNCLSELSEYQIDCSNLPQDLDLSDNAISCVSDEVFQAINNYRGYALIRFNFILRLYDNELSQEQKKELQKKFYKATHTIPERLTWNDIVVYKLPLAIAPLIAAACNVDRQYLNEPVDTQKFAASCLILFWWYYLFVNRFDMRLAKISHPTLGQVWGEDDIHLRSWAIWPKNESTLFM
ncbi:hypothetical protein BH09DEP1_BH09DEP1_1680 [soil metagenome]